MKRSIPLAVSVVLVAATLRGDGITETLRRRLVAFDDRSDVYATLTYDALYDRLVAADRAGDAAWSDLSAEQVAARQELLRGKMIRAMGGLPARTPLRVRTTGRCARKTHTIEKILFESRPSFFVTAHLFLPSRDLFAPPYAGILVPCGHSAAGKNAPWYQRGGVMAAEAGFAALVYDPIDQGERLQRDSGSEETCCTREHNRIGRRAALLGMGAASFRLWDAMRALDVLAERPEVDATRLGVMGMSGGGTLTSYLMATDDRIRAAAPAGYLTTFRDVCAAIGPQDAEQCLFGQLKEGISHAAYPLLRAPSPVMMVCSRGDEFPFCGARATYETARAVYARLGAADRMRLAAVPGEHTWYESSRILSLVWMRRWLRGERVAWPSEAELRKRDLEFAYAHADCGLAFAPAAERNVTETGAVLELPGARSAYDILKTEGIRQKGARLPLTAARVRAVAGIRRADDIRYSEARVETARLEDGVVSRTSVLVSEDASAMIPLRVFMPSDPGPSGPVLLVGEDVTALAFERCVRELLSERRTVAVAELRGFGETGRLKHEFYAVREADEELAVLHALLGENLVARRAEDLLAVAKAVRILTNGRPSDLVAFGRAAVPAAHAHYVDRENFGGIAVRGAPHSWEAFLGDTVDRGSFATVVQGAYGSYDWVDLMKGGK